MKQSHLDLNLNVKKTRKRVFLSEMDRVVPWAALVELISPYYPEGKNGRPPFALGTMLRVHFMQQWFTLSDPAMEEAFFDVPLYREFAQLDANGRMPDESTILRFRHRLEKYKLAEQILATVCDLLVDKGLLLKVGTAVDASLIAAPTSTKNRDKARDPEMHSSKKANQWYFGMKAHIGVDADSGLVHTVKGTAGQCTTSTRGMLCSMGKSAPSLLMQATGALKSALMPCPKCAGMWPCALAGARPWIKTIQPRRCWMRPKNSRPVSGPRSSIRIKCSSANSVTSSCVTGA